SAPGGSTAGAGPHLISCGWTIVCPSIVSAAAVEATPATATAAINIGNAIFMDNLLCWQFCGLIGMTAEAAPFRQRAFIVALADPVPTGESAMRATWLRQSSRPPMEPELGSTSAPFEKEGADRVVVGETNRAVKGLGGLMRAVPLAQQVGAHGPVGLVGD